MQIVMGLVLVVLSLALLMFARPNAEGVSPSVLGYPGVATAAALLFTVLFGLGALLVVFGVLGVVGGGATA